MKYSRLGLLASLLLLFIRFTPPCRAQQREGYGDLATPQVRSDKLGAPEHLRNYLADGKLRLSLRDAVVLTLENNSFVRIQETQVEFSKFALLGAHQPFDPVLTSSYNINSTTTPTSSQLQGTGTAPTVNSTTQFAQFTYAETFETGTNVQAGLNSNNNYTNNSFNTFQSVYQFDSELPVYAAPAAERMAVCQSSSAGDRAAQSRAVAGQLCR